MKAGGIMGIIGGVIALLIGAIGHSASGMLGSLAAGVGYDEGAATMQYYGVMSIGLPAAPKKASKKHSMRCSRARPPWRMESMLNWGARERVY